MRTDGTFKTKHVLLKKWKPGKALNLVPFGDVHRDNPTFADDAWESSKARWKHLAKNESVLFLGMGDYLDSFSTSERMIIYDSGLHSSTNKDQERYARKKVESLAYELDFMRGKLVGFMGGNHFPVFRGGVTGDQYLAELLDTDYLGACCAIRISFELHNTARTSFDIFAHHNKKNGATAGGKFNAVEKLEKVCDADIYLMGDNHARGAVPAGDRLRLVDSCGRLIVKAKPTWIGRTGSFLRGYVEDEPNYIVDGAFPPASLGHIEFRITPIRVRIGGADYADLKIGSSQ